jgi:hypothetical protein
MATGPKGANGDSEACREMPWKMPHTIFPSPNRAQGMLLEW